MSGNLGAGAGAGAGSTSSTPYLVTEYFVTKGGHSQWHNPINGSWGSLVRHPSAGIRGYACQREAKASSPGGSQSHEPLAPITWSVPACLAGYYVLVLVACLLGVSPQSLRFTLVTVSQSDNDNCAVYTRKALDVTDELVNTNIQLLTMMYVQYMPLLPMWGASGGANDYYRSKCLNQNLPTKGWPIRNTQKTQAPKHRIFLMSLHGKTADITDTQAMIQPDPTPQMS